jgi:predicted enzyme related to lactoylglutathione lyase
MALHIGMVTIDSVDPRSLADFWTAALDVKVVADYDGGYLMLKEAGDLIVGLQRVSEPTAGKNRVHLDLSTKDRTAEVARLCRIGADLVEDHQLPGFAWTVLSDPDGNVFCVGAEE